MPNYCSNFDRCLSIIFLGCALVSMPANAADTDDAKTLYKQICASCHGQQAKGNDVVDSPAIAGQSAEYLKRQLLNFSSGKRGANPADKVGGQMVEMAKLLKTDEQQNNMASYLSSLPSAQATPSEGDAANGFKYYQACGSCHGAQAEGNPALHTPRLAGLSAEYLKRQQQNFINGFRGSHKDDLYGRQMAMMAGTITDEKKLTDIIAFITSLNGQ